MWFEFVVGFLLGLRFTIPLRMRDRDLSIPRLVSVHPLFSYVSGEGQHIINHPNG